MIVLKTKATLYGLVGECLNEYLNEFYYRFSNHKLGNCIFDNMQISIFATSFADSMITEIIKIIVKLTQ